MFRGENFLGMRVHKWFRKRSGFRSFMLACSWNSETRSFLKKNQLRTVELHMASACSMEGAVTRKQQRQLEIWHNANKMLATYLVIGSDILTLSTISAGGVGAGPTVTTCVRCIDLAVISNKPCLVAVAPVMTNHIVTRAVVQTRRSCAFVDLVLTAALRKQQYVCSHIVQHFSSPKLANCPRALLTFDKICLVTLLQTTHR